MAMCEETGPKMPRTGKKMPVIGEMECIYPCLVLRHTKSLKMLLLPRVRHRYNSRALATLLKVVGLNTGLLYCQLSLSIGAERPGRRNINTHFNEINDGQDAIAMVAETKRSVVKTLVGFSALF